jgi:hypothetical protein
MFSKEWIITLLLTKTEQATAVANRDLALTELRQLSVFSGPTNRQMIFVIIKPYVIFAIYIAILQGKSFQFDN